VDIEASLSGVGKDAFERPHDLGQSFLAASLQRLRVRFADTGLVGRLLNAYALANKTSPEQVRKILSANMPVVLGPIAQPQIRNDLIFAFVGFLNDPQILELTSTMQSSMVIGQLVEAMKSAPATVPGLLALTAKSLKEQ
jgi:hypothetical protein